MHTCYLAPSFSFRSEWRREDSAFWDVSCAPASHKLPIRHRRVWLHIYFLNRCASQSRCWVFLHSQFIVVQLCRFYISSIWYIIFSLMKKDGSIKLFIRSTVVVASTRQSEKRDWAFSLIDLFLLFMLLYLFRLECKLILAYNSN